MHRSTSQLCDRARQLASLRLDGELSELEAALLDAHLARCGGCSAFAATGAEIAATLRALPPEPFEAQVAIPFVRGAGRIRALQAAAAAALVVAAAVLGSVVNLAGADAPTTAAPAPRHTAMLAFGDTADELRTLRRPGLIETSHPIPRNRAIPGESV
ncbi:MAG TPA: zf-HC2 domain-containing protein [Gaiellaceae bacterium]|nr:zf-HC2 domain-containing protein [Gaiellaceae bacterium]